MVRLTVTSNPLLLWFIKDSRSGTFWLMDRVVKLCILLNGIVFVIFLWAANGPFMGAFQGKVNLDQIGLRIWGGVPLYWRWLDSDLVTPLLERNKVYSCKVIDSSINKAEKAMLTPSFSQVPFIHFTSIVKTLPPLSPGPFQDYSLR